MSLFQALLYFSREALSNLVRSWKVSLLAISTIAVSLFLGGVFLLASTNLRQVVDQWRDESRVVIYLRAESNEADRSRISEKVEQGAPGLVRAQQVDPEGAAERFRASFPSLADLLDGWGNEPLPASLELELAWDRLDEEALEAWLVEVRADPAVAMVDDDRDWLEQLDAVILMLEGLAGFVGLVLLATAVFTIASVIRLTAYLYQDEIAVMRMVGATEFFIRGPFYVEGLLQGLAGGLLAIGLLAGGHGLLLDGAQDSSMLFALVVENFLSPLQLLALVALGGLAGLIGAVSSLRRESLGRPVHEEER